MMMVSAMLATAAMTLMLATAARAEPILYAPSASVEIEYTTLFRDEAFAVTAALEWSELDAEYAQGDALYWRLFVDGQEYSTGSEALNESRILPDSIDMGDVTVDHTGLVTVSADLSLDSTFADADVTTSGDASAQAINAGASIVPLIVVLFVAVTLQKVEIALVLGIFVGACMVAGELRQGFIDTFQTYLLEAVADSSHQFVILFSLFLSGLVAMMQRTGGMDGLSATIVKFARNARWAQVIAMASGILIFFDDYTNTLVIGNTMRPILDNFVSREKTAWITDATSAPIASISPISSWVGFEVSLIQTELDRITESNGGTSPEGLPSSAYAIFLETIAYRYYPIYLIVFQLSLALMQRDFGPMLVAERKVFISGRTDGGEGAFDGAAGLTNDIQPKKGVPRYAYNMLLPIAVLVLLVFWVLVTTGRSASDADADFLTVIQNSDSYSALLIGTVGAAVCAMVLYMLQFVKNGHLAIPTPRGLWELVRPCKSKKETTTSSSSSSSKGPEATEQAVDDKVAAGKTLSEEDTRGAASSNGAESADGDATMNDDIARPLLSPVESFEYFLMGLTTLFPAVIVLVLAWTMGSIMTTVGCDRLFSRAITSGLNVDYLPTITFIISAFMAIATGSSWSVMTIVFPLVTQPAWIASDGDLNIFYGTIAAVLAGSVLGDHCSPISDTTVLSCLASRCDLQRHVRTQAPYALTVGVVSIIVGTIPVGVGSYSTGAAMGVGIVVTIVLCFIMSAPTRGASGRLDPFLELYLLITKDAKLRELKEATRRAASEDQSTSAGSDAHLYEGNDEVEDADADASASSNSNNDGNKAIASV
ncbi:Malate-2H+/Na+-lactate antiporter [Hondaea fermentalgiana]|uniref:Malate-2H+/Na+-lactate antiporter n=1 Tax=Hondaea fermentalgiana TaxID=2315210 RepID=A0A2R5G6A1_9STRA|nr:Malate-2H+/Na+-lactate antiporter [Hondaea fermentalgiana]|eukprot:GBG26055.1 Malate-2H+/Na+-lactate antiporter [Hondaea fermentalgiana]